MTDVLDETLRALVDETGIDIRIKFKEYPDGVWTVETKDQSCQAYRKSLFEAIAWVISRARIK